jgi:hypothetical protein
VTTTQAMLTGFYDFFLPVSILVASCFFLLPMYDIFIVFKFLEWINITGKLSMLSLSNCASYINHANFKVGISYNVDSF